MKNIISNVIGSFIAAIIYTAIFNTDELLKMDIILLIKIFLAVLVTYALWQFWNIDKSKWFIRNKKGIYHTNAGDIPDIFDDKVIFKADTNRCNSIIILKELRRQSEPHRGHKIEIDLQDRKEADNIVKFIETWRKNKKHNIRQGMVNYLREYLIAFPIGDYSKTAKRILENIPS
jgi:hypothetical protein